MAYMQSLVDSFDRLKSKYNQLQTRCLTDKQKKECGVMLVAPQLLMPQEKDRQDEEMDLMFGGQGVAADGQSQSRMGGRIGARMDGLNNNNDGRPRNVSDEDDP